MPEDQNNQSDPTTNQTTSQPEPLQQATKPKRSFPPNCKRKPGTVTKRMQEALNLATQYNLDPKQALTLTNHGKQPCNATVANFKARLDKYKLSAPKYAKLASNVVLSTLKGEAREVTQQGFSKTTGEVVEYTEKIVPSCTNQLAAAAMVYDRVDPAVSRSENINVNVDCSPVDLGKWMNRK